MAVCSEMSTQEEASQYYMMPAKQDRRLIMSGIIADYENVLLWDVLKNVLLTSI